MNSELTDILDVLGGNKQAQISVSLDTDDMIKLAVSVAAGMLFALLLVEGLKYIVKAA